MKERRRSTLVSLSTSASLSYLHESSSNLSLHTSYIKKKRKNLNLEMKSLAKSYLCLGPNFQCSKCLFIAQTLTTKIPGTLGEQTLPQLTSVGRRIAAWAAILRHWCGQMATPCWWVCPGSSSGFILCWFCRWSSEFWRNDLGFLGFNRSILRGFFSTGFNLLILPWFYVCELTLI